MKKLVFTYLLVCMAIAAYPQKTDIPSLKLQLTQHINDTARVVILKQLSSQLQSFKPDSALFYAQLGLELAQKINYKKGEADCLNRLGVVLWKNGKYERALLLILNSLQIREKIGDRLGQLKSLNDIGIIYADQKDYQRSLVYQFKAKAVAGSLHDTKRLAIVLSNIGNGYLKLNKIDSALNFELQAYQIQHTLNDEGSLPNTLSILGDINYKMGNTALALEYYRLSIPYAIKNNDQSALADTYNSIALLYNKQPGKADSCIFYAVAALNKAEGALYPEGIYNASNLLTQIYKGKNEHLELLYYKKAITAKDSLFNAEKVKEIQTLSFNEAARQQEIEEENHQRAEDRIINLQLIGIALFIPALFLVLLYLSKKRVHRKVIEFMSVLSLLLLFEFITYFIHPFVQHISKHLPVLELLILMAVASVLAPAHHKLNHWLREKLVHLNEPGEEISEPDPDEITEPNP